MLVLTGDFSKLLHNLFFCFALRDGADKQSVIGHRDAHANVFARSDFTVVTLGRGKDSRASVIKTLPIFFYSIAAVSGE